MPPPMKWADFRRIMKYYGVSIEPGGKHWKIEKMVDGIRQVYTVSVHGSEIDFVYVHGARSRFKLNSKNGITDKDFISH